MNRQNDHQVLASLKAGCIGVEKKPILTFYIDKM